MITGHVEPQAQTVKDFELFLLNLRYKEGTLVEVEGNKPILLDQPDTVWIVYTGAVDLFSVPVHDGQVVGTRSHLCRGEAGQAFFAVDSDRHGQGVGLLVSGTPGTALLKVSRSRLWHLANELEYSALANTMLSDWVTALSLGVLAGALAPKTYTPLTPGTSVDLDESQVAMPQKGIVWVRCLEGSLHFLDRQELAWGAEDGYLPVPAATWIRPAGAATVEIVDTETVTQRDVEWVGLERFHHLALQAIVANEAQEETAEARRLQDKSAAERRVMESTLYHLAATLEPEADTVFVDGDADQQDLLLLACHVVGRAAGVEIVADPRARVAHTQEQALRNIVKASRVRMRAVDLRGEWWRGDHGPLLAIRERDRQPVALLPTSRQRYELYDPVARTRTPVTGKEAAQLSPLAYTFYRPLPNRVLSGWELLKFGIGSSKGDLRAVFFLGLGIALLGLVPPIMTGLLFNTIIPEGRMDALLQVGLALFLIALTVGVFQVARGVALLRLQSKVDASVQAAIWDRLLRLPTSFFRNYSAGDLGNRAMGVSELRRVLSGHILTTVFNSLFAVTNLALLFVYSSRLALVALGLVSISLLVTAIVGVVYVRYQRQLQENRGKVAGTVLQLLTGVIKFRVAGAEHHAFSLWSRGFVEQKQLYYRSRLATNYLTAFNAAYPVFAALVIFAMVGFSSDLALSTGDFLAFNLAFVQFLLAYSLLGTVLVYVLSAIPTYERIRPIIQTRPEVDETKRDPGELTGSIEVNHVSFRYRDAAPLALKDVSLRVRPGEFVALVGPSGSGKSTLLRLLLGFAIPESGGVYYDNLDLNDLDLEEVRRQTGVVLQNATVMAGDIYTNIIGSSANLTLDDAWEAARMAGLEQDLKNMPMGMHTVVAERGSNLSGGQRQRLLIARAMVNRPRILFFDEATSALDNQTQQVVSESLDGLHATRIVIAHRLSTIINADRIYVFESGTIVQEGTYDQLINVPGPFAELAKRQVV